MNPHELLTTTLEKKSATHINELKMEKRSMFVNIWKIFQESTSIDKDIIHTLLSFEKQKILYY